MAPPTTFQRWVRPECYPLFAATGLAVVFCVTQLVRNISGNPEVRCTKENRTAGILDNFEEGEKYRNNPVRKYVHGKPGQVFPGLNDFFSKPQL